MLVKSEFKTSLITAIIEEIEKAFGKNAQKSDDYGRIIHEKHFKKLEADLKNQKIIYGGSIDKKELYFGPTVIDSPPMNSSLIQDEIFGPILPILTYSSDDELSKILNQYKNPLAFYVFSNNISYAKKLIKNHSFGGGAINDTIGQIINKNLPFGGVGTSGIGKYHGYESFKTFSHFKPYIIKSILFDIPFKYKLSESSFIFRFIKKILKYISV